MDDDGLVYRLVEFLRKFDAMPYDEQVKITVDDTFDAIRIPVNLRSDFAFTALMRNAQNIMGEDTSKLDDDHNKRISLLKSIATKISVAATFMRQRAFAS